MTFREKILSDYSKQHALEIAALACQSKQNFKELIKCFLDDDTILAQRAAWSVGWAARKEPKMVLPHIKDLVSVLNRNDVADAVIRNAVRVLQETEIPKKYQGDVMNACFQLIESPSTPVAVKAFSLTILSNLLKTYPAIKSELKLIIEERWPHETAAFRSRAKKILLQMEKSSSL